MYAGSDATLTTTNGHATHTVFVGMGTPDGAPILPIFPMNRRAFCHCTPPHKGHTAGKWYRCLPPQLPERAALAPIPVERRSVCRTTPNSREDGPLKKADRGSPDHGHPSDENHDLHDGM